MSSDWQALSARAAQCIREGRVAEGISALERLLAVRPDDADSWFNLAYLHRCARHYQAALHAYEEAIRRGVQRPEEAHINRAAILGEYLNRTGEAADELRRALALNPRALIAWLNLGNLYEDMGDTEAARAAYREALKIDRGNGRALARLAAIDVFQGQEQEAIRMLEEASRAGASTSEDAAEISFALGSALDAARDYAKAFDWISQANRIAHSIQHPALRYDAAKLEHLVDTLTGTFTGPRKPQGTDQQKLPFFICGMFRSGSTLAEQMLARHSRVTAGGELEFIPAMVHEQLHPYPQSLISPPENLLAALRSEYLQQADALHPGWDRLTDKRPDNFLHVGLIKTLFPSARIIHTVRQPLDNLLSIYFLFFADGVAYGARLEDAVHHYLQYRKLMAHWETLYGQDILRLDYDRLVLDPRPEMERLLSFCGLEWEESVLDSGRGSSAVRTASNWQVRKPLHTRSSGRWRNYEQQLATVRSELERNGIVIES